MRVRDQSVGIPLDIQYVPIRCHQILCCPHPERALPMAGVRDQLHWITIQTIIRVHLLGHAVSEPPWHDASVVRSGRDRRYASGVRRQNNDPVFP